MDIIKIESVGSTQPYEIEVADLVGYIQPRVEEMLDFIRNEMIKAGFNKPPGGGIVLTGGTCQLPGLTELAARKLGTNVRIYRPRQIGVTDPSFSASTSVLQFISIHNPLILSKQLRGGRKMRFTDKFKAMLAELFG